MYVWLILCRALFCYPANTQPFCCLGCFTILQLRAVFFLVVVVVDLLCFWSAFVVTAHVLVSFEWVRETLPHDNRRNKRPAQSTCGGAHTSHSSRQPRIYRIPRTAANLVRRSFTAEKMSKTLNEVRLHNVNVKKDGEWQVEVLCADNKVKLSFA